MHRAGRGSVKLGGGWDGEKCRESPGRAKRKEKRRQKGGRRERRKT